MKAHSPSCHVMKKRRHRKGYLNLQTTDTTRRSESIWRQQKSGLSWRSRDCAKLKETQDVCYPAERHLCYLGRNDGISPMLPPFKVSPFVAVFTLWSTAGWVFSWLKQHVHVRCDAHLVQAPGSLWSRKWVHHNTIVCSQAAVTPRRKQALLHWTMKEAVLSPGLPLSTLHKSFQCGGVGFIPPRQTTKWCRAILMDLANHIEEISMGNLTVEVTWEFQMCF